MDSSYALAKNIVNTKYEDLPAEVVEATKNSILDTIGVILAATTLGEDGVKEIIELIKQAGGKEESTIIGFGGKTVSWMAAFANGSMAHQLDYDDTHDAVIVHPGASIIPAVCAIAERQGNITGKEFITAVALGYDVTCRLAFPLTRWVTEYSWLPMPIFGKFGAVSAAGKLLGLNETQMINAFGLVLNQALFSLQCLYTPGSSVRFIRDAFVAEAGVLSALLAQKGIRGDKDCLEGRYGLYNICWRGDSDPAKVTANLGKRFEGVDVSFKPWPCCRSTHAFIEATLHLVKEHDIEPKDVEEIVVVKGIPSEETARMTSPKTRVEAAFSLAFVLGVAVARRSVSLEDFTPNGITSNTVALELAQKVTYRFEDQFKGRGVEVGMVEIKTKGSSKCSSKEINFAYGHPKNPMAKKDLVAKFRDCAAYSVTPFSQQRIDEIIQTLASLEEVKDISQVMQLLV